MHGNSYYEDDISCTWSVQSNIPTGNMSIKTTPKSLTQKRKSKRSNLQIENIVNQNVNGWVRSLKIEISIENIIKNNIGAYHLQETWLPGDWEKDIRQ